MSRAPSVSAGGDLASGSAEVSCAPPFYLDLSSGRPVYASTCFSCECGRTSDTTNLASPCLVMLSIRVLPRKATTGVSAHSNMSQTNTLHLCLQQYSAIGAIQAVGYGRISDTKCLGQQRSVALASDVRLHVATLVWLCC